MVVDNLETSLCEQFNFACNKRKFNSKGKIVNKPFDKTFRRPLDHD